MCKLCYWKENLELCQLMMFFTFVVAERPPPYRLSQQQLREMSTGRRKDRWIWLYECPVLNVNNSMAFLCRLTLLSLTFQLMDYQDLPFNEELFNLPSEPQNKNGVNSSYPTVPVAKDYPGEYDFELRFQKSGTAKSITSTVSSPRPTPPS